MMILIMTLFLLIPYPSNPLYGIKIEIPNPFQQSLQSIRVMDSFFNTYQVVSTLQGFSVIIHHDPTIQFISIMASTGNSIYQGDQINFVLVHDDQIVPYFITDTIPYTITKTKENSTVQIPQHNFINPMNPTELFPFYGDKILIQNISSRPIQLHMGYYNYSQFVTSSPVSLLPDQSTEIIVTRHTTSFILKEYSNEYIQNTIILYKTKSDHVIYIPLGPVYNDVNIHFIHNKRIK